MSDDWQVGDLALCVATGVVLCPTDAHMRHLGENSPDEGIIGEVVRFSTARGRKTGRACGCITLHLADGRHGIASRFRKIRPDAHEPCEAEFVELLKRSKRPAKVDA